MFADADLDIKKKIRTDEVLAKMYELSTNGFF